MAVEFGNRSASLTQEGSTYVHANETIRCRRDYMIVEPLPADLSPNLQIVEHKRNLRGIVKAIGPGHYPKRYDHPDKHRRTKMWDAKVFQPTEVKVGDLVELGMIEGNGYQFQSFLWGDKRHIIVREADVSGVHNDIHVHGTENL